MRFLSIFKRNYRLLDKLTAKGRQVCPFLRCISHKPPVKCIYRGTYEREKLTVPVHVAPLRIPMSKIVFVSLPCSFQYADEYAMQVTGASGFLGSHIVSQLSEQGYRVRA